MEYILGMMRGNGMYPRNDQGKLEIKCIPEMTRGNLK